MNKIIAEIDYINGHLRYAHYELNLTWDLIVQLIKKLVNEQTN